MKPKYSELEALSTLHGNLFQGIETLRDKRKAILRNIQQLEKEKSQLLHQQSQIDEKLRQIEENLQAEYQSKVEYGKIIEETEAAYKKILESSESLLKVVQREAQSLDNNGRYDRNFYQTTKDISSATS
eukprot:jgi/Galph1/3495/GphlegSOOS_G2145.1